ncbi:hypothetical protein ACIQF6_14870 [Kitasatospora sp. NPDC092948]|uniref:hypothetical protein n=1 Tax=Kitasatospora sp. NPDC092948 TaxID=3364088 RepID=UPI0038177EF7
MTDPVRTAYEAYATATSGLNHLGSPMPTWDQLPDPQRAAWTAAIAAAIYAADVNHDHAHADRIAENRWLRAEMARAARLIEAGHSDQALTLLRREGRPGEEEPS